MSSFLVSSLIFWIASFALAAERAAMYTRALCSTKCYSTHQQGARAVHTGAANHACGEADTGVPTLAQVSQATLRENRAWLTVTIATFPVRSGICDCDHFSWGGKISESACPIIVLKLVETVSDEYRSLGELQKAGNDVS